METSYLLSGNPEDIVMSLNALANCETKSDLKEKYSSTTNPTLEEIEKFIDAHSRLPIWEDGKVKGRRQLYLETIGSDIQFIYGIENSVITIIGLGGVGSSVAIQLCKFGFSNFFLFDGDIVEEENLFKCLAYDENNIGKNKAESLREKLIEINPKVIVEAIPNFYLNSMSRTPFLDKSMKHMIVQCADKEATKVLEKIKFEYEGTSAIVVTAGCFEQFITAGPTLRVSELEIYLRIITKDNVQNLSKKVNEFNNTVINVGIVSSVLMAASLIVNEVINCIFLCKPSLCGRQIRFHLLTLTVDNINLNLEGL